MSRKKPAGTTKETAEPASKPAPEPMKAPAKGVKVRMYRTGLGDCFLLALPKKPRGTFYMLIDCGVYAGTPKDENKIRDIVKDIDAATGNHLDVLVVTHEHWDHVSGFHKEQAQDQFAKIRLDKLWLAWTEDLSDPLARQLHDGRKAARAALTSVLQRAGNNPALASRREVDLVDTLLGFFGWGVDEAGASSASADPPQGLAAAAMGAKKSIKTEAAMLWLRDVYGKGKTTFMRPGAGPLPLPGVAESLARVYVLGPPEDATLIRRSDPLADEVYPKAMAAAIEASFFAAFGLVPSNLDALPDSEEVKEASRMSVPFDDRYQIPVDEVRKPEPKDPAEHIQWEDYAPFRRYLQEEWRHIDGDWLEAAGEFALQLDNATNNTSLAFALEIGKPGEGKVLLFPGDAQVGNWLSWFGKVTVGSQSFGKDMTWSVGGKTVTARDLLRRTVLYKVGHHGSHNATLREQGLELMTHPELMAMLPVNEYIARDRAGYGEMPLLSLVKDLANRADKRILRSDKDDARGLHSEKVKAPSTMTVKLKEPKEFGAVETKLYFEAVFTP
jgi:hypothetical protein